MKMRTFDLRMYEYEEFIDLAKKYVLEKASHDGQGWFFFSILNYVTEETFLDWIKLGLVAVIVIGGKAIKQIPLDKRHCSIECEDAAFILY